MFLPVWCFFSPDVLCVHSEHLECPTEQFWLLASLLDSSNPKQDGMQTEVQIV